MPAKAMLEIAKYMYEKNVLPEDFDGVFRFTNCGDKDFTAKWNNVEYTFPAQKTSPMIIASATPEEVQNIRKKFAREWAIEQFYGSEKFKVFNAHTPGGTPALYTDSDLAPYIQKCLEPLPIQSAKVVKAKNFEVEKFLKQDEDGNNVSRVLKANESLIKNSGTVVA